MEQEATTFIVCENCGEKIGALETPFAWNEAAVCHACYTKLQGAEQTRANEDYPSNYESEPILNVPRSRTIGPRKTSRFHPIRFLILFALANILLIPVDKWAYRKIRSWKDAHPTIQQQDYTEVKVRYEPQ